MEHFNVRAELATRRQDLDDDLIDALTGYSPAVGRSDRGRVEVIITVPADTLRQAVTTALPLLEQAGNSGVIALEVMSTAEFDARLGVEPLPDLVSGPEAATILGVSRQRVLQMVEEGKLPGTLVGRSIVIPRAAVHAYQAMQQALDETITELVDGATDPDR
jgi:excisionase family DNA binding protein